MDMKFTLKERSALYRLLAETTNDIIIKTDRAGYILHASPAIQQLGFAMPAMLIGPHLIDLVHPARAHAIRAEHDAAIRGRQNAAWLEFPALTGAQEPCWFEIQIRSLRDGAGGIYGALSIMRNIDERKALEERLFAAELTDPLTGLTNRKAFMEMLRYIIGKRIGGYLAIFKIDHFKSINLRFGHRNGDRVLIAFADLRRQSLRREHIVSRIGGETLGVLMPGSCARQAEDACQGVIDILAQASREEFSGDLTLTASAGLAEIGTSLDGTIKRAEIALFLARAKGRNRLELDIPPDKAARITQH